MRIAVYMLSAAALAVSAALVNGTPVARMKPLTGVPLPAYSTESFDIRFVGGQRAAVSCFPMGQAYMGLYVFDEQGNCLSRDDLAPTRPTRDAKLNARYYCDDCGVVWYPVATSLYTIEVVSFGKNGNSFTLAVK